MALERVFVLEEEQSYFIFVFWSFLIALFVAVRHVQKTTACISWAMVHGSACCPICWRPFLPLFERNLVATALVKPCLCTVVHTPRPTSFPRPCHELRHLCQAGSVIWCWVFPRFGAFRRVWPRLSICATSVSPTRGRVHHALL